MAYVRPSVVTDGDTIDDVYFGVLRADWIAYETHGHTGATDGAALTLFNAAGVMSVNR